MLYKKEAVVPIYNGIYYSAIRQYEILPFATTWIDLENIMLSEISHKKLRTVRFHLYVGYKPKRQKWASKTKTRRHKGTVVTRGKGHGTVKDKGVKGTVMAGGLTRGGGHIMQYTDYLSYNCTLETYIISLTNVTPVNLIKKDKDHFLTEYK